MLLHDFLDYHAREHPESEFAVADGRRFTYREALAEVNRLASALVASGLERGDRIAIISKNGVEYVFLYFAASKSGAVLVPLNYRLAPLEWEFILDDAGARLLFAGDEFTDAVDSIRDRLSTVQAYVNTGSEGKPGWTSYRAFVEGQPAIAPDRQIGPGDDVYQMYTSGTTGRPKGAVLTHAAVTSNAIQLFHGLMPVLRPEPGDRRLIVAPIYHAAGAITAIGGIAWGGSLYLMPDFVPTEVVRVLSEERIVQATLVPAMIQALLLTVTDVAKRDYSSLRLMSYGASPIAEETLRRAIEAFRCEFQQGYGMTETTAVLTSMLPSDHRRALAGRPDLLLSAGRALMGTEVRIVDADDNPLPCGVTGEIMGRGPQLMRAYWNLPQATSEALRNGWMHTGDAGYMDEDGYVYLQDRIKDMVVSGGENIYPREVEEVLFQHRAIADAAVIGVPDPRWGEVVKAIVVLRAGEVVTGEELVAFCRGRLGGFKLPRSVDFVEALPRNASGKVLKRELREPYWAGQDRWVSG